ncbi:hypothetical protein [Arthrobacter sp. StoSoilB13]|uniref:hypothetical protein n=1 Tax=Arthrobacter sp. StoSoilB13 TaxID=2830993 RepID=UPI001CC541AA|nr:hypothetical protein [Arthrobacter sp. StoSoilB13]
MNKLGPSLACAGLAIMVGLTACASEAPKRGQELNQQPGVTASMQPKDAYANIPLDQIEEVVTGIDFLWDLGDPLYGYNNYPIVARVYIESIDGGRTFSPISNQSVFPQTVGKMTIREVYKGDAKPGARVTYSRAGGTVTYEDYWSSLNQAQKDKILGLNHGGKPGDTKYVQAKIMDDIDVEVGKEYLALLLPESSTDGNLHEYLITGYQYGLREAKGSGAATTVLNNQTHTWESLGSFVKLP